MNLFCRSMKSRGASLRLKLQALLFTLFTASTNSVGLAQTNNFLGPSNSVWNLGTNWSGGTPTSSSNVTFPTAIGNVNLNVDATVDTLVFNTNNTIAGATNAANALFTLTINNGATHTNNSGSTFMRVRTIVLGNDQAWNLNNAIGGVGLTTGLTITPPNNTSPTNTFDLNGKTLTKTGTGQLSFGGTNFGTSGSILIEQGSLRLSAGTGTPIVMSGAGTVTVKPGSLVTDPDAALLLGSNTTTSSTITFTKNISMEGNANKAAVLQYGGVQNVAQTTAAPISWSGPSALQNIWGFTAANAATANWTFSGDWSGSGTINMITSAGSAATTGTNLGAATNRSTTLSGNNSGLTGIVNNNHTILGVVAFGSANSGSASAEWQLTGAEAVYRLNGFSVDLGALSGTVGILQNNSATTAATATLGGKGINTSFSGVIQDGGAAALNLVKSGIGEQALTNTNTYTGTTQVLAGKLSLTGSGSINNSAITVNGGSFLTYSSVPVTSTIVMTSGTIGGTGSINTPVSIGASSTVNPGASPGTQAYLAGMTFGAGGTYLFELSSVDTANVLQDVYKGINPGHDWLNVTGTLGITSTALTPFTIDITGLGAVANWDNTKNYSWTIATASTGVAGFDPSFFSLNTTPFVSNNALDPNGSFSISADANNVYLNYSVVAIPEPSSYMLLAMAGVSMFWFARRK